MTRKLCVLATAVLLAVAAPAVSANELTFDDLTGTEGFTAAYNGFQFTYTQGPRGAGCNCAGSWYWSDVNPSAAPYYKSAPTSVSTDYELIRGIPFFGESLPITTVSGPVLFDGAWFTGIAEIQIQFHLYYLGARVGVSDALVLQPDQPAVFLASGYSGPVDKITVEGYQGYFAMDNFTYAPIPEPANYALLMAGLGGLGVVARKRRVNV